MQTLSALDVFVSIIFIILSESMFPTYTEYSSETSSGMAKIDNSFGYRFKALMALTFSTNSLKVSGNMD